MFRNRTAATIPVRLKASAVLLRTITTTPAIATDSTIMVWTIP